MKHFLHDWWLYLISIAMLVRSSVYWVEVRHAARMAKIERDACERLYKLMGVNVDEWFALGDRIMRPVSGLRAAVVGTIRGYRKSHDARGIRPTLLVEWDDGTRTQIDEDDLLFGLRGGAYVLA